VTDANTAGGNLSLTLLDGADVAPLFSPVSVAGLKLRNRLVMAPLTREFSPDGIPGADVAAYYARRASSLGLLITEGTYVDEGSGGSSRVPRFFGERPLAGWRKVVDAVHAEGGAIFPQLWHNGATRKPGSGPFPDAPVISPSGVNAAGAVVGEPATPRQLEALLAAYARAAAAARDAGFDGVELHGAHGYLLDQFLWHGSNVREDGYGGPDIAHRVRFPSEIVRAIRAECGADFLISLRFSQWKEVDYGAKVAANPDELERMVTILREAGVDVLHCSTRRFWEPEWAGDGKNLAGWVKALSGLPTITVGSVGLDTDVMTTFMEARDPSPRVAEAVADLETRMAAGEFDLVAVGRALIGDPDFVEKLANRDHGAIRLFTRADLGALEWDTSIVEEAHNAAA